MIKSLFTPMSDGARNDAVLDTAFAASKSIDSQRDYYYLHLTEEEAAANAPLRRVRGWLVERRASPRRCRLDA
jgi:hypothetical protein